MAHFGILLQISGKDHISGQKTAKRGFAQIFGLCVLILPGRSMGAALKGGVPPPPFGCCRESVYTMWAMHKHFFILSSANLSPSYKGFRTSETAKAGKRKRVLIMVTRLIKGQPAPLAIQRPKNQHMKRTKEEKKALKEKGLDGRTKEGKAFLEKRRQATFEKERKAREKEEEERRENKIHKVATIDTIADASSIALFSKDGNKITFRSLCGDGERHVRLLKDGAFNWEDIPHRYTEFDLMLKGEYYLSKYDCHNCPIAKLSGWISVYRCNRTFCILADEIEMMNK